MSTVTDERRIRPGHVRLMEEVCEAARRCCIAVSGDGESIDLRMPVGENADGTTYAFVNEGEQWTRAIRLVAAIDALDTYRKVKGIE